MMSLFKLVCSDRKEDENMTMPQTGTCQAAVSTAEEYRLLGCMWSQPGAAALFCIRLQHGMIFMYDNTVFIFVSLS